ncbi:plasmid replication protein RepC [Sulfitobacter aestuarii]|uniref:Plasmid replication protein RepC n=1 Tax=Sulfitobacter aestuarii TaxID=2161676 RepID=A0ABW5U2D4_9RHOB
MQHISTTPFGRSLRASDFGAAHMAEQPLPDHSRDKWAVMKDLTAARHAFELRDRDLAVLHALLSFHPHQSLAEGDGTIVFPSNARLAERVHGMAESTLRRHLAALVRAGVILRHDSPNGKRYARRSGARISVAYGFDLRPLVLRDAEIAAAAEAARAADARRKSLREAVVLCLRDIAQLLAYGRDRWQGNWDEISDGLALMNRALRRKLSLEDIGGLHRTAHELREKVKALIPQEKTGEMSGSGVVNERHTEESDKITYDSEVAEKTVRETAPDVSGTRTNGAPPTPLPRRNTPPDLPLGLVLSSCSEALAYATAPIRNWTDLIRLADFLAPMMGVDRRTWQGACNVMGPAEAAITLLALLQRQSAIRNPGGYLHSLTQKAAMGRFSAAPMIMSLLPTEGHRAA